MSEITKSKESDLIDKEALYYHEFPFPGKLGIQITKKTSDQMDLALAYSPGVAAPVVEIHKNPTKAYNYTGKNNLVAVISNGTAVLGLGNMGALASKPVMEGKAVLFKLFADINSYDIEVNENNPEKFIEVVKAIAPTFGGINLEDIKAPECFIIEESLKKELDIPVFHDDQHGTAIVISAGLLNALEIQQKKLENVKIVCVGAGAAGIATMRLLEIMGAPKENMLLLDSLGVINQQRKDLNKYKQYFATSKNINTLEEAISEADVFIGLAKSNLLKEEHIKSMATKPVIFALSNPIPEVMPEFAKSIRNDLIIATGRSDYPNQVNNVLCFPYIFRGALDAKAYTINHQMQIAAVNAIREIVHEQHESCAKTIGPEYIVPSPMDPRLKLKVSNAVKNAAIESNVIRV